MSISYHVVLKNQSGVQVALFDDWRTLSFAHRINSVGSFSFGINGDDSRASLFALDGQIEIYRSNLQQSISPYLEFEGLIRAYERRYDVDGKRHFVVEGRGYNDLLARRVVAYYTGSAYSNKSGVAETVMKEFVSQNAAASATAPPRLFDGVLAGLTVQADGATGVSWTGARAYRNLLEVLQGIANDTGTMDFDVVGNGAAAYLFKTYLNQRGTDRTTAGLSASTGLNTAGNAPVVFSVLFGNMEQPIYRDTRLSEINAVMVLGGGAEDARAVVQRTNSSAIADSPINRREISKDARNESATAGLNTVGDTALLNLQRKQTFNFKFIETDSTQYGRDFMWGDKVTARFYAKKIKEREK